MTYINQLPESIEINNIKYYLNISKSEGEWQILYDTANIEDSVGFIFTSHFQLETAAWIMIGKLKERGL